MQQVRGCGECDHLSGKTILNTVFTLNATVNFCYVQERQSEEEDAEIIVKIFVEFGHPAHAKVVRCILIIICTSSALPYLLTLLFIAEGERKPARKILRRQNNNSSNLRPNVV